MKNRDKNRGERPIREDLVLQACLEAYGAVRHEGRLADRALDFVLRRRQHLYSNERRAVAERVYALIRKQRLIDFLIDRSHSRAEHLTSSQRDVLRFAVTLLLDGVDASRTAQITGLGGNEVPWLRSVMEKQPKLLGGLHGIARLAIEGSIPDFLAQKFQDEFGDAAMEAALAMNRRAPLTIRTNTLKISRDDLQKALAAEGVVTKPCQISPLGLTLETQINVFSLRAFRDGNFEVQDEGSQLLGMLVDAPPKKVIDACAGAGGKTLQLAAQMKNRGDLYAFDIEERRLSDLKDRTRRAGVHNVRIQLIASGPESSEGIEAFRDTADRVLVDAPCSGSGTLRRKPDARFRIDETTLADHVARQKTLIDRFAALVKPGGRLIYGTCSVLRDEDENVVLDFLSRHPDFQLVDPTSVLGMPQTHSIFRDKMLRLYPHQHGTDGFFGAAIERKK